MKTKLCITCSTVITKARWEGKTRWSQHKYCSNKCRPAWNKDLDKNDKRVASYLKGGEATRFSSVDTTGDKNNKWKGDAASYTAKHMWMRYHYGSPKLCEHCGVTDRKMYHWANISRTYKRDRSDWLRLCVPCHKQMDLTKPKL